MSNETFLLLKISGFCLAVFIHSAIVLFIILDGMSHRVIVNLYIIIFRIFNILTTVSILLTIWSL